MVNPLPVKRVYDWGYKNVVLLRTHIQEVKPDWNIESLYAPFFYRNNPKLQRLVLRNDKIYARQLKYIANPPKDLNIIQVAPEAELECGIIANKIEHIQMDYRYGIEKGMDAIHRLKKFSDNLSD